MLILELPEQYITNLKALYGEKETKQWLENLPSWIDHWASQWNFQFLKIIDNLSFNFVALIKLESINDIAVLKMAPVSGEHIIAELQCLQCFKNGAPKILASDEKNRLFIMEYLRPGLLLKELVKKGKDKEATKIIAKLILELQQNQSPMKDNHPHFKHLSTFQTDLNYLKGYIEDYHFSKVVSLYHDLTNDRSMDIVLHGDLHHDNIIQNNDSWKIIDPHGLVGDPVAEVGAMIRNPYDAFPKDSSLPNTLKKRLSILYDELPFDRQRIQAWCYCITLLSAAWNLQDFSKISHFEIELAYQIDKIKKI